MPNRLRFQSDRGPLEYLTFRMSTEDHDRSWGPHAMRRYPTKVTLLADVVGRKGSFNPVDHKKLDLFIRDFPDWIELDHLPFPRTGTVIQKGAFYVPDDDENPEREILDWPWYPVVSAATLSDWSIEAFNKFHDQVPATVSVPNFIYELKDMKGMIPSFDKRGISKTAANNFLSFEFGVKPFISDIEKMVGIMDAVEKRLKHLVSVNNMVSDLTFVRKVDYKEVPFSFKRSIVDPSFADNDNYLHFVRTAGTTTFTIGGKLKQDLKDLSDSAAKLKALAATAGFNQPARVVWNAIPYSFVVDWFFKVGKLLDSLAIQPFGGEYSVYNVGYSVKHTVFYNVFIYYGGNNPPLVTHQLGYVRAEYYYRRSGFPAFSVFLSDGALTPKQLVLGLAMLEQKRR